GVFGIALASAALPAMSRQAAEHDARALAGTLNFALRLAVYICIPATVGLLVLRMPITRVLFERGRFTPADTVATAQALSGYAVGLVAFAAARITAQAFYAIKRPGVAVRVGVLSVAANIVAAVGLMAPLGHAGLAYASSVGAFVNLLALLWAARRHFGRLGGRALLASTLRTTAAAVPMALWCWLLLPLLDVHRGLARDATLLAAVIGVGGLVFFLASAAFGSSERRTLIRFVPGLRPGLRRRDAYRHARRPLPAIGLACYIPSCTPTPPCRSSRSVHTASTNGVNDPRRRQVPGTPCAARRSLPEDAVTTMARRAQTYPQ